MRDIQISVEDMLTELDALGFNDPDAPVNGGDCVDLMNQYIPKLRSAVARNEKAVAFVEAICDCATPEEMWDFVQNNFDKILDEESASEPSEDEDLITEEMAKSPEMLHFVEALAGKKENQDMYCKALGIPRRFLFPTIEDMEKTISMLKTARDRRSEDRE